VHENEDESFEKRSRVRFDLEYITFYDGVSVTPEPSPMLMDDLSLSDLGLDWFAELEEGVELDGQSRRGTRYEEGAYSESGAEIDITNHGLHTGHFYTPSTKIYESSSLARTDSSDSTSSENHLTTPHTIDRILPINSLASTHSKHIFWESTSSNDDKKSFGFFSPSDIDKLLRK
jgi:hypothetical protein